MLELEAFVQSQNDNPGKLAILPVYLGLSHHECTRNETRRENWLRVWTCWAKEDCRIDVGKWEDALKVLGSLNGIEYVESLGEVALREQIVSAIRGLTPPQSLMSVAHVQGRKRILKAIINKLVNIKPSPFYGVSVVGIYGVGGIGKTTFCNALCNKLYMKFQGRVCHAQLGSKSEPIELHKEVLRRLTDVNHDSLKFMNGAMTMDLLKQRIRQQRVFLALDNVWQESLEQAKDYLKVGFYHGSIVMVTARSIDILGHLNIDKKDCLEMPDLEEEEAKQLFLHSLALPLEFLNECDEPKIQHCLKECRFGKGVNMGEHFHPLALKVLGRSLGCDPSLWVENLSRGDKFNQSRQKEHPIFDLFGKGYESLCEEDQLLFMDAVLFHPSQRKSLSADEGFVTKAKIEYHIFRLDIYKWLSIIHNLPEGRFIKDRLQVLKAKSLIEDIGDGFTSVIIHDLYLDFAKLEVKKKALDVRRWVWYDKEAIYLVDLAKTPSGSCWSNVLRMFVKYVDHEYKKSFPWMATMKGMDWHKFCNVVVLQLFIGRNDVLNLEGFHCLKSMELKWGYEGYKGHKSGGQLIGLGSLKNLAWLDMRNIHFAPCFQEIGQLTRLEVLCLDTNCSLESPCQEPLEPSNLDNCILLQELVLECPCLVSFPNLRKLTSLRKILFKGCENAKEVIGLGSQMTSLQELLLLNCHSLGQCPGLSDVVRLEQLDVEHCSMFHEILDLHKLTKLQRLNIRWNKFNKLLGLNDSMPLLELLVCGFEIEDLPNLHLLRHLQWLRMEKIKPTVMPLLDSFFALKELILKDLQKVRDIHGMRSLTRLKRLTIVDAPDLLQLPELGDLMALQELWLHNCCRLVENLDLPDLQNLIHLEVLEITATPIRRFPSLEHLTQLRDLCCSETLLVELPILSGLEKLEWIDLAKCRELTSLENVGTLPALLGLDVRSCSSLTRLPNLESSKSLEYLSFCHTQVRLDPEDIWALATLPALEMSGWDHIQVPFSKLLEKMSLGLLVLHLEAEQLEYFITLQTRTWIDPEIEAEKSKYSSCHPAHACDHSKAKMRRYLNMILERPRPS